MKTAVIYKSIHHENTKKVAEVFAENLNADLYDLKDFNEDGSQVPDTFTGTYNYRDGVSVSTDNLNWYKLVTLVNDNDPYYRRYIVDLDAFCTSNSIAMDDTFYVKFQQYNNEMIPNGGYAFDDIVITDSAGLPRCKPYAG